MSREQEHWNKIEEEYLATKERELDMPELWSRIEEKLDQNQEKAAYIDNGEGKGGVRNIHLEKEKKDEIKETGHKNIKSHITKQRKVAVFGTLAVAAMLAFASYSLMRSGVNKNMNGKQTSGTENTSDSASDLNSSESSLHEELKGNVSTDKQNSQTDFEDSYENSVESHDGAYLEKDTEDRVCSSGELGKGMENTEKLLYIKKENQFYEFSVNLEKYYLQLVEISVNKKENVFAIAQSDFSSSAWKILQEKLEDISAYTFYVDSEGALYIEKKDRYYQIHLEEKGDGFDGK